MHLAIKDSVAMFVFEDSKTDKIEHNNMIEKIMRQVDDYDIFVFDFSCVEIKFNSIISGFILTVMKSLMQKDKKIEIKNMSWEDWELLDMVGLKDLNDKYPDRIQIEIHANNCEGK